MPYKISTRPYQQRLEQAISDAASIREAARHLGLGNPRAAAQVYAGRYGSTDRVRLEIRAPELRIGPDRAVRYQGADPAYRGRIVAYLDPTAGTTPGSARY